MRRPFKIIRFPRGFTFVELMVGMVVTSIVLCALTVFTFGVSDQWQQSDAAQSVFLAGTMAVDRLNRIVRSARMIDPNASATTCMLWLGDMNGDSKIQFNEQGSLYFDAADQELLEYIAPAANTVTNTPSSILTTPVDFLAAVNLTSVILAHDVKSCQFIPIAGSGSVRPSLEIILTLTNGTAAPATSTTVYTTIALRTPGQAQ